MKNKVTKILFLLFIILTFSSVRALKLEECEVNEYYTKWQEMSDEEKSKYFQPAYCKSNGVNDRESPTLKRTLRGTSYPATYTSTTPNVKDQGLTGTCWANASTSTLEAYIIKKNSARYNFSPGHLNYRESTSFYDTSINRYGINRDVDDGGFTEHAMLYYANEYGPVLESTFPTVTNVEDLPNINSSTVLGLKNTVNVNEIQFEERTTPGACTFAEKNLIKSLVSTNGAVAVSYYHNDTANYYVSYNSNLGKNTYSYLYKDATYSNHVVTIVGWDDNYSVSNFSANTDKPNSNGAWLVQNSWGTSFGNNGLFYISYEDPLVCTKIFSVRDVDFDTDDNRYIQTEYPSNTGFSLTTMMNVYTTKSSLPESLNKVKFEVSGPTGYKVYYYAGDAAKDKKSTANMTLIAEGYADYRGFVSARPKTSIKLPAKGNKYSIAVVLDSGYVQAEDDRTRYYNVKNEVKAYENQGVYTPGTSYVYSEGNWFDLYNSVDGYKLKAPISVFTSDIPFEIKNAKVTYKYDDSFNVSFSVSALESGTIKSVRVVNSSNKEILSQYSPYQLTKGQSISFNLPKFGLSGFVNGTYEIQVIPNNGAIAFQKIAINVLPITGVSISNSKNQQIALGKTLQLNAVINPSNHNSTNPKLTWTSSNTKVATVNDKGLVTGVASGKATITVKTTNGKTTTYEVTVTKPITNLVLNPTSINLNIGGTKKIGATIQPTDATENKTITWSSSDNKVATVDNQGNVKAIATGTATIKAVVAGRITKTVAVSVNGIKLNKTNITLEVFKTDKITATVINANPSTSKAVTWTSSNAKVATVDKTGKVTATGAGTATITAKDASGRVAKTTVKVNKANASNFAVNSIALQTYNGKAKKPKVVVKYNGKSLKVKTDYTVKYANNKNPGEATITITANPKSKYYTGSKKVTFVIKPKKTVIKKPKTKSKTITVTWTSQPKVKTYQLDYRIKGQSNWQTLDLLCDAKKVSNCYYKIEKLTKGKTYQVRVRTYLMVGKTRYNGTWSNTKTIKCK